MRDEMSFDKKLAELDAYLQLLITQNEQIDAKIDEANSEPEKCGLVAVKNDLEDLLGSIKHAIVLLQIAKVSLRTSSLDDNQSISSSKYNKQQSSEISIDSSNDSRTPDKYKRQPLSLSPNSPKPPARSARKTGAHQRVLQSQTSTPTSIVSSSIDSATGTPRKPLNKSYQTVSLDEQASSSRNQAASQERALDIHRDPSASPTTTTTITSLVATDERKQRQSLTDSSHSNVNMASDKGLESVGIMCGASENKDGATAAAESCREHAVNQERNDEARRNHDRRHLTDRDVDEYGGGSGGLDEDDDDAFYDAAEETQNNSSSHIGSPSQQQQQQHVKLKSSIDSQRVNNKSLTCNQDHNLIQHTPPNRTLATHPYTPLSSKMSLDSETKEDSGIDWDALYDEEEEDLGSLENQGSVIKHLMSQIRIGMDLTKVVLPTFILERRSLLEMYADFFAHPDLFSQIPDFETPEERMIAVVRWYLSAFHAGRKSSVAKKPYNPILGEIFSCHWNVDSCGDTNNNSNNNQNSVEQSTSVESMVDNLPSNSLLFIAEQVSHHPPVSAFYAENPDKQISCCAHIYTKSKYLGLSVGVHNIGQGIVNLKKHNESYVATFPSAYGRSILTVPWVELGGSVDITCEQTGYTANIEFLMKPFYGGKKHRVTGQILRPNKQPILCIEGEWNGVMHSKNPNDSSQTSRQVFVDTTCLPVIKKQVRPISNQESFESRNVWKEVTRALKMRDVTGATAAKTFIEQRQRDLLKDRQDKGVKWKTRFFKDIGDSWTFQKPNENRQQSD